MMIKVDPFSPKRTVKCCSSLRNSSLSSLTKTSCYYGPVPRYVQQAVLQYKGRKLPHSCYRKLANTEPYNSLSHHEGVKIVQALPTGDELQNLQAYIGTNTELFEYKNTACFPRTGDTYKHFTACTRTEYLGFESQYGNHLS